MTTVLNFSNPNNSCLSLRILAEKVRTGDVELILAMGTIDGGKGIRVELRARNDQFVLAAQR